MFRRRKNEAEELAERIRKTAPGKVIQLTDREYELLQRYPVAARQKLLWSTRVILFKSALRQMWRAVRGR